MIAFIIMVALLLLAYKSAGWIGFVFIVFVYCMVGILLWLEEKLPEWWGRRKFLRRYDIGRMVDGKQSPYLTRYDILGTRFSNRWPKVFLHRFHRSDFDEALHDHPWPFWSLILWGGYWEITADQSSEAGSAKLHYRKWYGPGRLLRRHADWTHRVELPPSGEGRTWSLVLAGVKTRSWGFHCPKGWTHWRDFTGRSDRGEAGCE